MAIACWSHRREKRLTSTFWRIRHGSIALREVIPHNDGVRSLAFAVWTMLGQRTVGPAQQLAITYTICLRSRGTHRGASPGHSTRCQSCPGDGGRADRGRGCARGVDTSRRTVCQHVGAGSRQVGLAHGWTRLQAVSSDRKSTWGKAVGPLCRRLLPRLWPGHVGARAYCLYRVKHIGCIMQRSSL
jgi:hypothetical protein